MTERRASSGNASTGSSGTSKSSSSSWNGLQPAHRTFGGSGVPGPWPERTADSKGALAGLP
eukprot:2118557-Lingulodinium_polyedra.AAC.1